MVNTCFIINNRNGILLLRGFKAIVTGVMKNLN